MLDHYIVVLHRPRDLRNIGAVVRAMKNMGFGRLRLVEPVPFDPADIRGIAHRSDDILASLEIHTSLDSALADARIVVGTSARQHPERSVRTDLAALAGELVARAAAGPVALLFGPEDNGLDHAAIDRCGLLIRLPCDPAYPSLNLAQAVLLLLYELRQAAQGAPPAPPAHLPAPAAELERVFAAVGSALDAIDFHKSGDGSSTMRALRVLVGRAAPDAREAALIAAIAREVVYALRRHAPNNDGS